MAAFSALLSSRMAPSTERSASRLLGNGFSSVVSTGIELEYNSLFLRYLYHNAPCGTRPEIIYFLTPAFPLLNAARPTHRNFFRTLRAVCAEFFRASMSMPVHRFGNPVQKFFALAKKQFSQRTKKKRDASDASRSPGK